MKICLVLGAGASLANGLHFRPVRMRSSRPPLDVTFFQTVEGLGIQLAPSLRSYLREILGREPTHELIRTTRMEEFFKDLFFDFQDSPNDSAYRRAYIELIDLYVRVLRETTNWLCADGRTGGPVGRLLAAAADGADVITVITFNHDLVIENEIYRRARLRSRWCLDEGYGSFSDDLNLLTPGTPRPIFPLHREEECNHSRPITVLKLHGSLNWIVRLNSDVPTARTLSGEAGERKVWLVPARQALARTTIGRATAGPGRSSWRTWPVIIPPIYAKLALRRRIQPVWQDARSAIDECERLVFFGYSLPEIDVESEKLFERGIATNQNLNWADIINPSAHAARRYAGLAPGLPIRWFPSLGSFLGGGGFGRN